MSATTSPWWTTRSIIAAARTSSAKTSPQRRHVHCPVDLSLSSPPSGRGRNGHRRRHRGLDPRQLPGGTATNYWLDFAVLGGGAALAGILVAAAFLGRPSQ